MHQRIMHRNSQWKPSITISLKGFVNNVNNIGLPVVYYTVC